MPQPDSTRPGDSASLARLLATEDAVVEIPPGDYTGPFKIAKGVTAKALGGAKVRLLSSGGGPAVLIAGMNVTLEDLEMNGVLLGENSQASLRRCAILDSPAEGIHVPTRSKLELTDSEIARSQSISVHLNGGEASLRQCRIHSGRKAGLVFSSGSRGTISDCEVSGHLSGMPLSLIHI